MQSGLARTYAPRMSTPTTRVSVRHEHVHANGADVHYVEAGEGPPLLLLHAGFLSTHALWEGHPAAYVSHLGAFAGRFRVIAPDTRGHGLSLNPGGGSISYAELADDVLELSTVLGLERPLICGFSDGGTIATVAAIRSPDAFRAVVNHAGFDFINPQSRTFAMARQVFGGSPEATKADPESFEAFHDSHGGAMADFARRMKLDHRSQGSGGWKATLAMAFDRMTTPSSITLEHLRKVTAPALILTGDRDMLCSAEEAVAAYRMLSSGELAIVPGTGHELSAAAIELTIAFLQRQVR
jgi:pimeloyl-ACP methyl ester carboxylesterase